MSKCYFLGANSGGGFISLYGEFCRGRGDRLYLIKGGPGGGKSSFMREIAREAEQRGYEAEYILCSGDPDSLDGVYIPALKTGLADATAPHVLEPSVFGVDSHYVNLGQFCAASESERIGEYTAQYKSMYSAAYSYLAAAKEVRKAALPGLYGEKEICRVKTRVKNTLKRELSGAEHGGTIRKRFISCISCKGDIVLNGTVSELCKRTYKLDGRFGSEQVYLREVYDHCRADGIAAVVCLSPLCPDELDAVLIPEKSLAFMKASLCGSEKPYRHIRLDAFIPSDIISVRKQEIRRKEKLYAAAMESAHFYLAEAKRYHDLLENEYKPLVDFERLNEFRESFIGELFSSR